MLNSEYYKNQINRESQAIINYSRNGSIYNANLEEIVPLDVAKKIENRQNIILSISNWLILRSLSFFKKITNN